MKRSVVVLLILCLLFGLAACGGEKEEGAWSVEAETLPLPEGMTAATAQCLIGESVYVGGFGESGAALGCVRLQDGAARGFTLPASYEFIYALCEAEGALAVLAGDYPHAYYDAAGELHLGEERAGQLALLLFDLGGDFLGQTPLDKLYPGESGAFSQMLFAEGGYILMSSKSLVRIDADGKETNGLGVNDGAYFMSMCADGNGLVIVESDLTESVSTLYRLDGKLNRLQEELTLADTAAQGIGLAADGRLLLADMSGVFLVDQESGAREALFQITAAGMDSAPSALWMLDGGYLLFQAYQDALRIAKNVYVVNSGKTALLLATDRGDAALYEMVKAFNKESEAYEIVVKEYDNIESKQLITEITVGKGPDLFYFSGMNSLVDENKLGIDLLPYLDADPDYDRDTFVPSLMRALTKSGELHCLPISFGVITVMGPASVFDGPGVSLEEVERAVSQQEEGLRVFPAWLGTLGWMARFSAERFVDRESGTCDFANREFMDLLEMCGRWGRTETEYDREPTLLNLEPIQTFARFMAIRNYRTDETGGYCFIGFPGAAGNGSMFWLEQSFVISVTCKYPEAAWAFIRTAFKEDMQSNLKAFTAVGAELQRQLESMEFVKLEDGSNMFTPSDIEKLRGLMDDTTVMMSSDDTITDIILEEGGAYFDGDSTLEEAVGFIQSRVGLYLAEQS